MPPGGVLGVLLALTVGWIVRQFGGNFRMIFSVGLDCGGLFLLDLIGVLFGFLPARNAARLDPVDALSRQ